MTFLSCSLLCLGCAAISIICCAGYILAAIKRSATRWAFVSAFAFFMAASMYFAYQRYEPCFLIKNHMAVTISRDTVINKYHADLFARDSSYSMMLTLSAADSQALRAFFANRETKSNGPADAIPATWPKPNKDAKRYETTRGSVYFYLAFEQTTRTAWLFIAHT